MCYSPDIKTDFKWRSIDDEEKPCADHTYLVSDGEVIGLCGYTIDGKNGEGFWEWLWNKKIDTVTYYGGHTLNPNSKTYIYISEIKYWCPIPLLSL